MASDAKKDVATDPWELADAEANTHVSLTFSPLAIPAIIDRVRSPQAGAIVLFAGTTRDNSAGRPVSTLSYSSYVPLALRTLSAVAHAVSSAHSLMGVSIAHRLGEVPIGQESILIAVSAPHREAAWAAGQAALEDCKRRVEVWKREVFVFAGGVEASGGCGAKGVWRANDEWTAGRSHATRGGVMDREPVEPNKANEHPV